MMVAVLVHHLLHLSFGSPPDEALHQGVLLLSVVGGLATVMGSILVALIGQMRRAARK
jgi:hypothetical protein